MEYIEAMRYKVNPGKTVTHRGDRYHAGAEFELDKEIGNFHVRAGSCRPYDPDIDDLPPPVPVDQPLEIEETDK